MNLWKYLEQELSKIEVPLAVPAPTPTPTPVPEPTPTPTPTPSPAPTPAPYPPPNPRTPTSVLIQGRYSVPVLSDPVISFFGPAISRTAEALVSSGLATYQSNRDTFRPNDQLWDQNTANYGYGIEGIISNLRGSPVGDKTDAYAFLDDYYADLPGWFAAEQHLISFDFAAAVLNNAPNSTNYRAFLTSAGNAVPTRTSVTQDAADIDYDIRLCAKDWEATLACKAIGLTNQDYTTISNSFVTFVTNTQSANGFFPDQNPHNYCKFFTYALLVKAAIFHYRHIGTSAALFTFIKRACEFVWVRHWQKTAGIKSFPYLDLFASGQGDWRDGDSGFTSNGTPDVSLMWLYAFGWLYSITGDSTWITRADSLITTCNSSAFFSGDKQWQELCATGGWAYSYFKSLTPAAPTVPVCSAVPSVSGTARVGQTLTASTGTWNNSPTSYSYQWYRMRDINSSGGGMFTISGATNSTYVIQAGDQNYRLWCSVIATNASGSGTANVTGWTSTVSA